MSATPMTIEEARAVLWLRNNHRPLGELLDEGFLTRARLEWAAENAYDVQLKRAAAVLLEHVSQEAPATETDVETAPPALDAGMSIEEARSVAWPLPPHKGKPMGSLVDAEQINLNNLGYAVENAWDERVRRAAAVLAAVRLNQAVREPPAPAGPLNVVSGGRSYARRRESFLNLIEGFLLGVLMMLCVGILVSSIRRAMLTQTELSLIEVITNPIGVTVLTLMVAVSAGAMWVFLKLLDRGFKRLEVKIDNYQRGQEGEERVVEGLRRHLDGEWTVFRNVVMPGRSGGDIDMVLVGPPGVFALEVKCYSGAYRNVGDRWEFRDKDGWKAFGKNPSEQANRNARRLGNFFKADGIHQWVNPAVVWAEPGGSLLVENPLVAIWRLERIGEEVGNLWTGREMESETLQRVTDKLTLLCQRQREKQASRE